MPNKRSADKRAITVFLERDLVAAAKAKVGAAGPKETLTAVIERALTEYVTPPPPSR